MKIVNSEYWCMKSERKYPAVELSAGNWWWRWCLVLKEASGATGESVSGLLGMAEEARDSTRGLE